MNGKGSAPRPRSVDAETFAAQWARTFGADPREALREANLREAERIILADGRTLTLQSADAAVPP